MVSGLRPKDEFVTTMQSNMKTSERGGCPICLEPQADVLHRQEFPDSSYDLVCCTGCGFVYADTPLPQSHYDAKYAASTAYSGPVPEWDRPRHAWTAANIKGYLPNEARVLDVGAGSGGLVFALRDESVRAFGMDPSPTCVEKWPFTGCHVGSLFNVPAEIGQWDCVVLSHVLEHVRDLHGAMRAVDGLLKPGGVLYAEVPDAARYADHFDGPFQQINTEHINHFTLVSLANLLRSAGLMEVSHGVREFPSPPPFVASAVWMVVAKPHARKSVIRDWGARDQMRAYLARSAKDWERVKAKLAAVEGPVIAWGCGQLAKKLWPLLKDKAMYVVDRSRCKFAHMTAALPQSIIEEEISYPIVVTTILHEQAIVDEIKRLGLKNKVVTLS